MTLVEMMVASTVGVVVCTIVLATLWFCLRSYQALTNYQVLNYQGRTALDILSRDVRQANGCSTNATFSSSAMTLYGTNAATLRAYTINYSLNTNGTVLTRTYTDTNGTVATMLLSNLTTFAFSYYLRNPTNASFEVYSNDSGRANLCKLVQVDWACSRSILGNQVNTMDGESARIVIRKE